MSVKGHAVMNKVRLMGGVWCKKVGALLPLVRGDYGVVMEVWVFVRGARPPPFLVMPMIAMTEWCDVYVIPPGGFGVCWLRKWISG